ncbi:hypothetical protein L207DRAFT_336197 [Hyaloscypha variabilis F]|uniref:Uncharacterized protein n=1 Tax=Hyaloscypha variabilis (strain UAMH 11265 / GT02V1 / F) TaxID=1149755 RepID=A0A2J6RNX8_HYAVF|nr:hypothetical protein L207DRAFT_336197 [Hyaloscypha variabilis F]
MRELGYRKACGRHAPTKWPSMKALADGTVGYLTSPRITANIPPARMVCLGDFFGLCIRANFTTLSSSIIGESPYSRN